MYRKLSCSDDHMSCEQLENHSSAGRQLTSAQNYDTFDIECVYMPIKSIGSFYLMCGLGKYPT